MKLTTFRSQILNVREDEPLEGIGVRFYGGALTKTLKSDGCSGE